METSASFEARSAPSSYSTADADHVRLEQVFGNLLSNAIKYTPVGGRIQLFVERAGHEAVFRIQDSGIGIAPQRLNRIFELFAQEKTSVDRSRGGLGIGLALVRSLVEMHRGTVTASSAGAGQGSTFEVRLPITAAPAGVSPEAEAETPPPGKTPVCHHILVVEDDPDNRLMLKVLLERMGHRVETAVSGQHGVEMMLSDPPEAALIDIGLPDLDGYEVARQVRAQLGERKVFLVACTGYGRVEDRARASEAGFDAHLVKPVNPDELAALLAVLDQTVKEKMPDLAPKR